MQAQGEIQKSIELMTIEELSLDRDIDSVEALLTECIFDCSASTNANFFVGASEFSELYGSSHSQIIVQVI